MSSVKYVVRAGLKNPETEIEDLEKAIWYIEREKELIKARAEGRPITRPNDMNPRIQGTIKETKTEAGTWKAPMVGVGTPEHLDQVGEMCMPHLMPGCTKCHGASDGK